MKKFDDGSFEKFKANFGIAAKIEKRDATGFGSKNNKIWEQTPTIWAIFESKFQWVYSTKSQPFWPLFVQ